METTDRGMCIPGTLYAISREYIVKPCRIFGQIFEGDRAVLNERDRFTGAFHGHHDIESGLPHFDDVALQRWVDHFQYSIWVTVIRHHLTELGESTNRILSVVRCEFNDQNCAGIAAHEALDLNAIDRDFAGKPDHGVIHQLDGRGPEFDDMLAHLHGVVELLEVAYSECSMTEDWLQFEFNAFKEAKRAFRTDQ